MNVIIMVPQLIHLFGHIQSKKMQTLIVRTRIIKNIQSPKFSTIKNQ